ncbi:conserved hypothetical protein [Aspergillus terreus NIH2624]|uniref:VWFA domain-containing protein n=1 Tax=Aspergillus terreus (strain NIH 2624 / FGSC A1156) TaxID=341663 RepID=Q0CS53_ASPTN|nr:uncharacterized protein ATEG_03481 [Aspergillus terreus NIH2624]EAU36755.1 conserved hypothetical protein [Aspergillus terreus NIH2624]
MAHKESSTLVGCLLDVSGSMRKVFETGRADDRAVDRFHAVLGAALQIARKEQQSDSKAKMFVGAFGLDRQAGYPPTVDLCGIVKALLGEIGQDDRSGHELLIEVANENHLAHITEYIQSKLTDTVARIVHACLRRHPERICEFIDAIPSAEQTLLSQRKKDELKSGIKTIFKPLTPVGGATLAETANSGVDKCGDWELQLHATGARTCLSATIEEFMYGDTPMRDALNQSLAVFRENAEFGQRVLVLMTDGYGTDGDPSHIASELRAERVTLAGVYLTNDRHVAQRRLYDQPASSWNKGQRTLFHMASKVSASEHPIPVLVSVGWQVPYSGEVALQVSLCTETAVEEFCSLLVSAHLGSTDALLDVIGRLSLDEYINDRHITACNDPSNQGNSATCYAHAIAAVMHMALLRIERRDPCPSIEEIRNRILREFPPGAHGRRTEEVLSQAVQWHRLRYRAVDEIEARKAVLHRRPVLTTFRLSDAAWTKFRQHFRRPQTHRSVLTETDMRPYRRGPQGGGHAVVLYACDPHSLSFLNSWGSKWGSNGSFRVQSPAVLETDGPDGLAPVRFYDVFWYERDLTASERAAYEAKVDEKLRAYATEYPSLFELEATCPLCQRISVISDFTGNAREARCPRCLHSFVPQPGHLVQALYARAGLGL